MALDTKIFINKLIEKGYTHLCIVPCSFAQYVINESINNPDIEYLPSASEAACSIAAGLKMAGKKPIVIVQSSSVTNMGSCIRSLLKPYGVKFPILSSWRTYKFPDSEIQHQHLATELPTLINAYGYESQIIDNKNIDNAIDQIELCDTTCTIGVIKKDSFDKIKKALIFGSLLVCIIQISFLLSAYGTIPSFITSYFQSLHPGHAVLHLTDDFLLFTFQNTSSLIFLIPFLSAYILLSNKIEIKNLILLLIVIILILLTGRRAFFLSYGFSLLFLVFVALYLKKDFPSRMVKKLYGIVFFLTIFLFGWISFSGIELQIYMEKFNSIFDFSSNDSNLERVYQFRALCKGITNAPLIVSCAGAAADYSRSSEQPWAYELSYVAFMFHYGILGFLIYLYGIIYIFVSLLKICKDEIVSRDIKIFIIFFLTGFMAFMVANATNPYLGKFDYMWVIFILIMIINAYNIEKRKQLAEII